MHSAASILLFLSSLSTPHGGVDLLAQLTALDAGIDVAEAGRDEKSLSVDDEAAMAALWTGSESHTKGCLGGRRTAATWVWSAVQAAEAATYVCSAASAAQRKRAC